MAFIVKAYELQVSDVTMMVATNRRKLLTLLSNDRHRIHIFDLSGEDDQLELEENFRNSR
jgi:hypothetical protein